MAFQRLRMNKKGVEFKSAFFAMIIFSMCVIAIGVMITGYEDGYDVGVSSDLEEYDKLDEVSADALGQKSAIGANDPDPSEDAEANTFRGVYGILVNIFSSFDLVFGSDGMLQSVANRFNVPSYVIYGIVSMMMIAITFSLIAIIFRLARRSA